MILFQLYMCGEFDDGQDINQTTPPQLAQEG